MSRERGNVWLGVAGIVIDDQGRWLVVKKRYGGLLGKWSLPAGFVQPGETADHAAIREIREETGIACSIIGMAGLRTGVLHESISDNMLVFLCKPESETIVVQEEELLDARWMDAERLMEDRQTSVLIHELIGAKEQNYQKLIAGLDPGSQFGYTAYKLFL